MPTFWIIIAAISFCAGGAISYLIFHYKIKIPQIKENEEILALNEQLSKKNDNLREFHDSLIKAVLKANSDLADKQKEILEATFKLEETKIEAQNAKEEFLKTNLELAQNELDKRLEEAGEKYQEAEDAYLKEYLSVMADMVHQSEVTMAEKQKELDEVSKELDEISAQLTREKENLDVVVETRKAERAEEEKVDFYRLQITPEDQEEIDMLKKAVSKIRDPIALNKAIWKVYYEKPYMALVGRVVGPNRKTGIYKITNIRTAESYVGQAVDIAERWKQHIKRGIGAETPTRNKLYPAMAQNGVDNFIFQILVECPPGELNEKEDYYQEMFHCKDYGYSIK